ncbi:putative tRNA nucleotidyltransferase [Diplogelasinospora grovesii]|uniref:tRNA nucleotidyltransferase n=1 Tax=Diplogelasinospora grovesii TaxID=303347 RepID=A0AAN6S8Q2_9PEZI|nr:putative tRNA nucleotidyltransferase [Diplogelasinospora grovesii]
MRTAFPRPRDLDHGWLALSKVTGREFGKFLESFSAEPEIESKYRQKAADLGIPGSRFTRFHIMERNAGMSKKLETAGGKLFGLDIDLVNLRKEVYDGQSRTPEMEFGTPEEDAFRRDATVNSIFFHLEKQEIVDLTGRGLKDLDARIMTTPLDPRQTFMDDPLRHPFESNLYTPVFIRLDSSLLQALQAEFPILGLSISPPWPITWPRAYRLLAYLLKDGSNLGMMVQSEENVHHLWIMAAYAPTAGLRQTMLRQAVQEATAAIRTPARISKLVESALKNFDSIHNTLDTIAAQPEKSPPRSLIGIAIRSWGATWSTQVTYVMLAQAVYAPQTSSASGSSSLAGPLLERYSAFADFVWDKDLRDAHLQRPLLDGNEIQSLFGLRKGGKFLKSALDDLLAWQFDHVDSGIGEAKAWLLGQRERLGVPSNSKTRP